jgi:hypothetical protein
VREPSKTRHRPTLSEQIDRMGPIRISVVPNRHFLSFVLDGGKTGTVAQNTPQAPPNCAPRPMIPMRTSFILNQGTSFWIQATEGTRKNTDMLSVSTCARPPPVFWRYTPTDESTVEVVSILPGDGLPAGRVGGFGAGTSGGHSGIRGALRGTPGPDWSSGPTKHRWKNGSPAVGGHIA